LKSEIQDQSSLSCEAKTEIPVEAEGDSVMPTQFRFTGLLSVFLVLFLNVPFSHAQAGSGSTARRLITQPVDEDRRVILRGNTRPEANPANDRGAVSDALPMEHMQLQLRLPAEKEQELEQFISELHDRASQNYHKWLTPDQFRQQFSLAQEDSDAVTAWLQSEGFTVNVVYPRSLDFSGTAGQVRNAFKTEIHQLEVNGVKHIANMTDPQIPATLAPAIVGIVSLNDFMPHKLMHPRTAYTEGNFSYVVPADLATIYDFNPPFENGVSGQGQTIVVLEDSDVYTTSDWDTFRAIFGLASAYPGGSFTLVHPAPPSGANNCIDPGVNGDQDEAIIDAEWASAGAPNAAIVLASCSDTSLFGGFIALQNLLNGSGTAPAIVSISYGESEAFLGQAFNVSTFALYQQAVTEGVSVFVAAGDWGASAADPFYYLAVHGIAVSGFASTPYNVAVGGTDFGDTFAGTAGTYWNSTNGPNFGSARSYVPEIPWNDSCASALLATFFSGSSVTYGTNGFCDSPMGQGYLFDVAGSGGPSGCANGAAVYSGVVSGTCAGYAKPSWQVILGNPADGVRDIPDVSLFAADGIWGHLYAFCWSNGGIPCNGDPGVWDGAGGTSFAAPIMAAIQALVNQAVGGRSGNPDPAYYSLAAAEYGVNGNTSCNSSLGNSVASTCVFHDVTQGDVDVPCTGVLNCYLPSGVWGVLSTSNSSYQPSYGTQTGWDFATGIGSVDVANLVNSWTPTATLTANGEHNILAGVGSTINYTWSSSENAVSAVSSYTVDGGEPNPWVANTLSGSTSGTVAASQAGHTYVITYTVTNSVGQTSSDQVTIAVATGLTASLTANGAHNLTVGVGSTITYNWSSANGASAVSSYTVDGGEPNPWVANTLSGSTSGTVAASQAGHTYVITYAVTNSVGQTSSDQVTIAVQGASYTYTGNAFNIFRGSLSCPSTCRITGSFTLPQPLTPNMNCPPTNTDACGVSPTSFSFTDGTVVITQANAGDQIFIFVTDATGAIIFWQIDLSNSTNYLASHNRPNSMYPVSDYTFPLPYSVSEAEVDNDAGTWSGTTVTTARRPRRIK
jgi:subtilase family serine protease